nr:transporter associated domain-containing protein [Candidatus Gracilibacteria bacterium]
DYFDNVVGILNVKELLRAKQNRNDTIAVKELDLSAPIFIPESKELGDLFKEFQWKRQHMSIVVDEHASVTGLVTLEDVLEEIIGDITDETDEEDQTIRQLSETSWWVNAEITIEKLNDLFKTNFCCDEHKTLRYLLIEKFKKIPRRGDDIQINGFHFFMEKVEKNKICSVRMIRLGVLN